MCGEGVGGETDGQIEGCGENMTQPSMGEGSWQSESRREKFQETSREKLGMGRQGLRQRGNLIVTGKEESLLARGSSRDLRVRLLGSWATKGPVYIECSEGVQPQRVRCSQMLAQLSWRSHQSLLRLPAGCVGLCQIVGGWRKEPGWLQPLGPVVPL